MMQSTTNFYLRQPGLAPSNAGHVFSKFRFKCKQMSACRHSGNPFSTEFMSMPFVYVQACWKYSSRRCRSGFGIWNDCAHKVLNNIEIHACIGHDESKMLSLSGGYWSAWQTYLMETNEFPHSKHLRMITRRSRIQPLYNRRYISENACVHER